MKSTYQLKCQVYQKCLFVISEKINSINEQFALIAESKANETKSSAGDKYETSREMRQQEEDKLNMQLANAGQSLSKLKSIVLDRQFDKVEFGSFVKCSDQHYFLAIGLGKVLVDEEMIYVISPIAPLGKALLGKSVGDEVVFNGKTYLIESIS